MARDLTPGGGTTMLLTLSAAKPPSDRPGRVAKAAGRPERSTGR
ncbi:hypothetical protein [Kitasatospora purpeofusca]